MDNREIHIIYLLPQLSVLISLIGHEAASAVVSPAFYCTLGTIWTNDKNVEQACCSCGGSIHVPYITSSVPTGANPSESIQPSTKPSTKPTDGPLSDTSPLPSSKPSSTPSVEPLISWNKLISIFTAFFVFHESLLGALIRPFPYSYKQKYT